MIHDYIWHACQLEQNFVDHQYHMQHHYLLRIMGSGCGKTSLLSLPCAPESVKTRASSGMFGAKAMKKYR